MINQFETIAPIIINWHDQPIQNNDHYYDR